MWRSAGVPRYQTPAEYERLATVSRAGRWRAQMMPLCAWAGWQVCQGLSRLWKVRASMRMLAVTPAVPRVIKRGSDSL